MFKDEVDIHFEPGDQIAYVPLRETHELKNPFVEYGFVTSVAHNNDGRTLVFCRFWNSTLTDLRTKNNSEGCDWFNLIHCSVVDSAFVENAWRTYVSKNIVPPHIGAVDTTGAYMAPAVGSLATVKYVEDLYPAIVVNVKLDHKVSKSHSRLIRIPVRIDIAELKVDNLKLANLRRDSNAPPLFDSYFSGEDALAHLGKKPKITKAAFDTKQQLWRCPGGATLIFGAARYRRDYAS